MSFSLTGNEKIVIYGAGSQGKKLIQIFQQRGYTVKVILDRKAEQLHSVTVENQTINVIHPDHYVMSSDDEVVIISLWNAMQHDQTAESLHALGFRYIVYLPMTGTGNRKLMSQMRMIFNEILDGRVRHHDIPEYQIMVEKAESISEWGGGKRKSYFCPAGTFVCGRAI